MNQKPHFRILKLFLGGIISLYTAQGILWIAIEYHALREDEGMALIIFGHDFEPMVILPIYAAGFVFGIYIILSGLRQKTKNQNEN